MHPLPLLGELDAQPLAGLVDEEQLALRVGLRVPDGAQEAADVLRLVEAAGEEAGVAALRAAEDVLRGGLVVALDAEAAVLGMLEEQEEVHGAAADVEAAELLGAADEPCVGVRVRAVEAVAPQRAGEVAVLRLDVARDPRRQAVALDAASAGGEGPERLVVGADALGLGLADGAIGPLLAQQVVDAPVARSEELAGDGRSDGHGDLPRHRGGWCGAGDQSLRGGRCACRPIEVAPVGGGRLDVRGGSLTCASGEAECAVVPWP